MLYKELRKVLRDTDKIELSVFKPHQTRDKAWTKIYFVRDTKHLDNLKVDFVGSQEALCNGEKMLVADLVEEARGRK